MTSERLGKAALAATGVTLKDSLWYVLAAGLLWLLFHVLFRRVAARRKVVRGTAPWGQLGAEVVRSLRSILGADRQRIGNVFPPAHRLVPSAAHPSARLHRHFADLFWGVKPPTANHLRGQPPTAAARS